MSKELVPNFSQYLILKQYISESEDIQYNSFLRISEGNSYEMTEENGKRRKINLKESIKTVVSGITEFMNDSGYRYGLDYSKNNAGKESIIQNTEDVSTEDDIIVSFEIVSPLINFLTGNPVRYGHNQKQATIKYKVTYNKGENKIELSYIGGGDKKSEDIIENIPDSEIAKHTLDINTTPTSVVSGALSNITDIILGNATETDNASVLANTNHYTDFRGLGSEKTLGTGVDSASVLSKDYHNGKYEAAKMKGALPTGEQAREYIGELNRAISDRGNDDTTPEIEALENKIKALDGDDSRAAKIEKQNYRAKIETLKKKLKKSNQAAKNTPADKYTVQSAKYVSMSPIIISVETSKGGYAEIEIDGNGDAYNHNSHELISKSNEGMRVMYGEMKERLDRLNSGEFEEDFAKYTAQHTNDRFENEKAQSGFVSKEDELKSKIEAEADPDKKAELEKELEEILSGNDEEAYKDAEKYDEPEEEETSGNVIEFPSKEDKEDTEEEDKRKVVGESFEWFYYIEKHRN